MSKIITPTDSIIITIDNRLNPPQATMKLSRDMPAPWVAGILAQLVSQLMGDMMRQLVINPLPKPALNPNDKGDSNGST